MQILVGGGLFPIVKMRGDGVLEEVHQQIAAQKQQRSVVTGVSGRPATETARPASGQAEQDAEHDWIHEQRAGYQSRSRKVSLTPLPPICKIFILNTLHLKYSKH